MAKLCASQSMKSNKRRQQRMHARVSAEEFASNPHTPLNRLHIDVGDEEQEVEKYAHFAVIRI
jgi:hypothetical protein